METEVSVVLASGKCRRRFSPDHALFAAGNALRARAYSQYDGAALLEYEESDGDDDEQANGVFRCRLFTCDVGFRSVAAYEEHYDLVHRNVCLECYRPFLSLRLLDMHISETHDAFFKVLSKRQPMYACLVDGCTEMFMHDDKRSVHLVQAHQYPPGFSFHRARCSQRRALEPSVSQQSGGTKTTSKKKPKKKTRKPEPRASDMDMSMDVDQAATYVVSRGESPATADDQAAAQDTEMLDALAQSVRDLRIPKTVRFGRRQRGR